MDEDPPLMSAAEQCQHNPKDILPLATPKYADPASPRRSRQEENPWEPVSPDSPVEQGDSPVVVGRLRPRLEDPHWLKARARDVEIRKSIYEKAVEDGVIKKGYGGTINPTVPIAGMPVPPASHLGSSTKMQDWFMRYNPENTFHINANPAQHVQIFHGRPLIILILTHEGADVSETDGYFKDLFYPAQPIVLVGYTVGHPDSPGGPSHFCVIRLFQVAVFLIWLPSCFSDENTSCTGKL